MCLGMAQGIRVKDGDRYELDYLGQKFPYATKGHPKRKSASVHQIIMSRIEEHSKKPDETRNRIVELVGDLPRIELFAR